MAKSIFLEGTDGTGKSTQLALLKDYLEQQGETVVTLREPGGSNYYEALREFYKNSPHEHPPISDALLSAAGRAANIAQTKQALNEGVWVLSDRSYLSSYVYQSVQGVQLADIQAINAFAMGGFAYDIKILLDAPIATAMERVNANPDKKDYWESLGSQFFENIRQTYLKLAKEEGCVIIDTSKDMQKVHSEIIQAIATEVH